jgi:hypothetical protein
LLSYAGIGLAFAHDLQVMGETTSVLIGAAFVFGSSLSYALYLAGSGPAIAAARRSALHGAGDAGVDAGDAGAFSRHAAISALLQPLPIYAYGAAMALFSTVLPVFMQSAAIRRIGSAQGGADRHPGSDADDSSSAGGCLPSRFRRRSWPVPCWCWRGCCWPADSSWPISAPSGDSHASTQALVRDLMR